MEPKVLPKEPRDYFSNEGIADAKSRFPKSNRIHKLIARLKAAEACADVLDANYQTIADNSDEDDLAIVEGRLKAWRKASGK